MGFGEIKTHSSPGYQVIAIPFLQVSFFISSLQEMNTKPLVRLVRKAEGETREVQAETGFFVDPNSWSTEVQ